MTKIKNILKNKRGASIMEFFIMTIVALVIGAIIFLLGGKLKSGVGEMDSQTSQMGSELKTANGQFSKLTNSSI